MVDMTVVVGWDGRGVGVEELVLVVRSMRNLDRGSSGKVGRRRERGSEEVEVEVAVGRGTRGVGRLKRVNFHG